MVSIMMKRKHSGGIQTGKTELFFDILIGFLLLLFSLTVILPFWYLLAQSFDQMGNMSGTDFYLWPRSFTFANYSIILHNKYIWAGYANTLLRTILGTVLTLFCTTMGAYTLSKKYFPHHTFWSFFVILTMFFGGGLIPTYLWINQLGLIDNRMVLILPSLVGAYNLVLVRNFMLQIPAELEESARLDGAGDFRTFLSIVLPVSKPILATVALWVAVGHWNSWFDCLLYIRDPNKLVVQVVLQRIIIQGTDKMLLDKSQQLEFDARPEMIKAACIYVTTLPILCVYPFLQKYFVKGIYVGSLKG
ncbi:MAG: carbohydrate ABC transporter permease [Clostridiaceae bacterium]|nr:carbohydrate ABC transporter permease [Clostridiaceae bacterium]